MAHSMSDDSPQMVAAQALKFLGLLVSAGGSLAILRTGQRSLLFALLMLLGLIMWGIGFWLAARAPRQADPTTPTGKDSDHG